MKFQKILLDLEKYKSLDIIAASPGQEATTQPSTNPQQGTDPYEADKW